MGKINQKREIIKNVLALAIVLMAVACNSNTLVGESRSITGGWEKQDVVEFEIPPLDSLQAYHLFLHVRNTNEYPYNNLFLIASMEFPYGKTVTDTLEYRMAAPDGSWLGTGIGTIKENKLWYKEGVRFFEEGSYKLRVSHAMRNNGEVQGVTELVGITEVGYSVEQETKDN